MKCTRCGEEKPENGFYRTKRRKNGRAIWCKKCQNQYQTERRKRVPRSYFRNQRLKCEYGITSEDYTGMLSKQGGGCAICGRSGDRGDEGYLNVDHSHRTGTVRGLLCTGCNQAVGQMRDDPGLLRRAAVYLERTE